MTCRNSGFSAAVNDIVVEFGDAKYQGIIDGEVRVAFRFTRFPLLTSSMVDRLPSMPLDSVKYRDPSTGGDAASHILPRSLCCKGPRVKQNSGSRIVSKLMN